MPDIVISSWDLKQFGCPHCGYRSGYTTLTFGGAAIWRCGDADCRKLCHVLAVGLDRSPFNEHPQRQPHPRQGIPAHGRPDARPEIGEYFASRGIGRDHTPGCFVCGGRTELYSNIAAFVRAKAAGERVVQLFTTGARLDYREGEPDRVQVKIGACAAHLSNLERLDQQVNDGVITAERIDNARRLA